MIDTAFKAAIDRATKDGLAAVHKAAIDFVRNAHREQLAAEPRPGGWRAFVDGQEGVPFERVRPGGTIAIDYSRLPIVAEFAMNVLFALSPVHSGAYRSAHMFLVHWQPVRDLRNWRIGDEIMITNPLPYSRIVELGKMRMRVPGTSHVYEQARSIVANRFKDMASVRFTYRSLELPYIGLGRRSGGKLATPRKRAEHNRERETRLPVLIIDEPDRFRPRGR